jgi:hypothetical protein
VNIDKTPIYPFPFEYAAQSGEADAYHNSMRASTACAKEIDAAILNCNTAEHHYDLKAAVKAVTSQFSFERVNYVLSNILRYSLHDGRYSRDNKAWAQDFGRGAPNRQIYSNTHPTVLDGFVKAARKAHVHELAQTVGSYEKSHHMALRNRLTYDYTDIGVYLPCAGDASHKQLIKRCKEIEEKQQAAAERRQEKKSTLAAQLAEAKEQVQPPGSTGRGKKRETQR